MADLIVGAMHARPSEEPGARARGVGHPLAQGGSSSPPPPRVQPQVGPAARSSALQPALPAHTAAAPAPDAVLEAAQGAAEDDAICIFSYGPQAHADALVRPCSCSTIVHPRCWAKWVTRPIVTHLTCFGERMLCHHTVHANALLTQLMGKCGYGAPLARYPSTTILCRRQLWPPAWMRRKRAHR